MMLFVVHFNCSWQLINWAHLAFETSARVPFRVYHHPSFANNPCILRSVIATGNSCLPTRHLYFCCQMGWATSPSLASLQSRRISDHEHALNSRPPSWIGESGMMSTTERLREWDWGSHEPKWRLTQYRMNLSVAHQKRLLCRNTEEIRIWRHFPVSVRHHGREHSVNVEVNFTSSGSSIFLVLNLCCGKCI